MESYDPYSGSFGKVSLADLKAKGRWTVLVFYPADFTFVCPTELADFAEQYEKLISMGCELISVSTDTQFAHPAEACPARWSPGKTALKPSEKLVGKVHEALNEAVAE